MIKVRRSEERGHVQLGWLDTYHTFSFGEYYDEQHMGFRSLRVINDDRVAPGRGFGTHPHRDMEILTYVLEGALEHRDSMGNGAVIYPGEVQVMSAGTGITHSEFNPSSTEPVHLLQIWFLPERRGLTPRYDQKLFSREERQGTLRLVASRDERDGSVLIQQDAELYATLLDPGQSVEHSLRDGRYAWVHVARGAVTLNGVALQAGDGAAVSEETRLELTGVEPAEVLVFDLG